MESLIQFCSPFTTFPRDVQKSLQTVTRICLLTRGGSASGGGLTRPESWCGGPACVAGLPIRCIVQPFHCVRKACCRSAYISQLMYRSHASGPRMCGGIPPAPGGRPTNTHGHTKNMSQKHSHTHDARPGDMRMHTCAHT